MQEGSFELKGSFRFRKEERIHQPQDFKKIMRLGKKISSQNFEFFIHESENPFHRLGIVMRKEIGPATLRNRIKRYLREFFRLNKSRIKNFYDIVILVKKGCSIHRYHETEDELKKVLIKYQKNNEF